MQAFPESPSLFKLAFINVYLTASYAKEGLAGQDLSFAYAHVWFYKKSFGQSASLVQLDIFI